MAMKFKLTVEFNKQEYEVDVIRTSPGVHPNSYFATIVVPNDIFNKYPQVVYETSDNTLLYVDSLSNILPGFAEKQKNEIINYLNNKNIPI
jgi:hypothetical protein